MISIIIFLLLAWAFYVGYSRGLELQIFYSVGMIVVVVFAITNYETLAAKISMWIPFANATPQSKLQFYNQNIIFQLDKTFYSGVAFLLIVIAVYLIFRFVGIFLGFLSNIQPFGNIGSLASGLLAVMVSYFILESVFTVLAMVPINAIQDRLYGSGMIRFMVLDSPFYAKFLMKTLFENVIHLNPIK